MTSPSKKITRRANTSAFRPPVFGTENYRREFSVRKNAPVLPSELGKESGLGKRSDLRRISTGSMKRQSEGGIFTTQKIPIGCRFHITFHSDIRLLSFRNTSGRDKGFARSQLCILQFFLCRLRAVLAVCLRFPCRPCRFSSIGCGCPYASPFFPLSGFGALFRLLPPFFPFSGPHSFLSR